MSPMKGESGKLNTGIRTPEERGNFIRELRIASSFVGRLNVQHVMQRESTIVIGRSLKEQETETLLAWDSENKNCP